MKYGKYAGFTAFVLFALLVLQGCSTDVVKQGHAASAPKMAYLPSISDADTSKLFQQGVSVYLHDIANGYKKEYINGEFKRKPLKVVHSPLLRQAILSTGRGKALTTCKFPALRIELDGKKETTDWLVTTLGKGGRCAGDTRYFWIVQQDSPTSTKIFLQGRGKDVGVNKPKSASNSEVNVGSSTTIKINSGDKLANGSWLQVKASDKGKVFISCKSHFRFQGNRFQPYEESVEASVNTPMGYGKSWQPVNNPRYRCPF